jgi:glycosyltransferase involved in cell wall biosynthesis
MAMRMANDLPQELLKDWQIIHSRVREFDPNLRKLLVLHDLPNDPESDKLSDPDYRSNFEKIVCVSDWQLQQYNIYKGLPYADSAVINNAIKPIDHAEKPTDVINIVYHTTPHRGLALLVPVFDALTKVYDNIHLHVYSSFGVYGWEERDRPYEGIFHYLKNHPKCTYHGAVSNEQLREDLKKMHIFAYPSIWPETSCLAAIEAFSARCFVVAPNYAGLTDTMARWGDSYQWNEDPEVHARVFFQRLNLTIHKIQNSPNVDGYLNAQKQYFDTFYNWDLVKDKWIHLLESL